MRTISSKQNPLVKRIREAIREHADEIVIEGPKAVADAIASGWKTDRSVLERGVDVTGGRVRRAFRDAHEPRA